MFCFFFKQKTAYEMRISDWSSDVCSSDLPLGNFSSKIKMCYCLGLIDKMIKEDLNLIRKIRNEFAHDLYASFDSDKIKNWCLQLKWHKIIVTPYPPSDATPKDYFQVGVNSLITHLNGCVSIARSEKRSIKNNF